MAKECIITFRATEKEKEDLEKKAKLKGLSLGELTRRTMLNGLNQGISEVEYNKVMMEQVTYMFKMIAKLCRESLDEHQIKSIKKDSEEQLKKWGYR